MPRLLFICTQNRLRSPTAERVFADWPNVEVESAGLNNGAGVPVTPDLLDWADVIFVMEEVHRTSLRGRYAAHLRQKRVVCLNIPDHFEFMDSRLVKLLEERVPRYLKGSWGEE